MEYDAALAFLDSLVNYERERPRRYDATAYDLARFETVLQRLGRPQDAFPIIHVVGSKGKGSTAVMLAAIMRVAGKKAALFTSPHLRSVRERVTLDGEMISPADFAEAVTAARSAMAGGEEAVFRTYFETTLAAALWYFRKRGADCVILEAGLGGRLDATNVVTPAVVAITPLDLEHTDVLGTTLGAIAREKAAVMKRSVPAVSAPQDAEALAVLRATAAETNSPLRIIGDGIAFAVHPDGTFSYRDGVYDVAGVRPCMPGPAQRVNAAVALGVSAAFTPFALPPAAARAGVENAFLPARAQFVPGAPALIVDVAHSPASARELASVIRYAGKKPVILLWGMVAGKDVEAFCQALAPVVNAAVATAAAHPRALPAAELATRAEGFFAELETASDVARGWSRARELAGPEGLVVVSGSFYVAGEFLTLTEGATP